MVRMVFQLSGKAGPFREAVKHHADHATMQNGKGMRLPLTSDQAAAIEPHIRIGWTMLGKIEREAFDGSNATTSGRLVLELGTVPTASLPALREAITKATAPARKRKAAP